MWRLVALVLACWFAALTVLPPAGAEQVNADMAKALVGKWVWTETSGGITVKNQIILGGDGTFALTSAMDNYQVSSTGTWIYEGGWLKFTTLWSSSLDSAGHPVAVAPIQVQEVGPDFVRMPAGIARRVS